MPKDLTLSGTHQSMRQAGHRLLPPRYRSFRLTSPTRASQRMLELTMVFLAVVSVTVALNGPTAQAARPATSSPSVAEGPSFIPGDYVTFHCANGEVTLNGTSGYCYNQTSATDILHTGSWTMRAIPLPHFHPWNWTTAGAACLDTKPSCDNSTVDNPVGFWVYCASGARCTGSVTAFFANFSTSHNWAGYELTASNMSITKVTGSWIQPYVDCTTDRSGQAAFWAGIDGFYGTGTVEQGGSAVYCRYVNPGWIAVYYAWYEFYPAGQQPISSIVVNANDTVSVTIAYSGNNSSVSVTVSDGTHSYTAWNNTGNDTLSTAECIAERPYQDGLTPLAKFSTAEFG